MEREYSYGLSKYIKQGKTTKKERAKAWETAIGLQEVDGLKPSKYLIKTIKKNIEGDISVFEVRERINDYYINLNESKESDLETEEADKVSIRIVELLNEKAFSFSPSELKNIHKRLFQDIFKHAGEYRNYNFTKKEWVLDGETVIYSSYENIERNLEYDFNQEKNFSYKSLGLDESIKHISSFIANIWQTHPFCEGNTRTTAVFLIKYLKTFGFDLNDELFSNNAWYFRNALVRANYRNYSKNIYEETSYLEKFIYNLLTDSNYELSNRTIHINFNQEKQLTNINDRSLEELAIINIIKKDPYINQEEISRKINKSIRTVKNYMAILQTKDIITRVNGKKNSMWVINK